MHERPINWHEGMFLTPQHFQASDRWHAQERALGSRWNNHYDWGIRSIDIDADALKNYRLVIQSLQARLPDGELLSFPEDGVLPVLDLRDALRRVRAVRVQLALPLANPFTRGVTDNGAEVSARHLVDTRDTADRNTGSDGLPIQILRPNVRLLVDGDDQSGFETLPVLQVRRSESASNEPEIDPEYIPPLLACDAWAPLQVGVLVRLLERLERKASVLTEQAVGRGLDFDSAGQGERLLLEQIRTLYSAIGVLSIDVTTQGVAPLTAYRELGRLVGLLSPFSPDLRSRTLPPYDHDDLARCFLSARREIESLLSAVIESSYQERPFTVSQSRLAVELEPTWLEPTHRLFIGVQSSLPANEAERLLTTGRNLKVGSLSRVDELYLHGDAGLELRRVVHTPRALPVRRGLEFYELGAEQAPDEWRDVQQSMSLAVRIGEQLIVDTQPERGEMVLSHDGKASTLRLSIFAMKTPTERSRTMDAQAVDLAAV